MRGLWIENGRVDFRSDLTPPAPSDECRVRVHLAGICSTDLALARGYMSFTGVPGHEFVGVAIDGPLAGQRVVGEINAGCGECDGCRANDPRHCRDRTVLGILGRPGCFAEELSLPVVNLLPVPESIDDVSAVFTEPLAAAFEILEQTFVAPGLRALVAGDGRLGLLCAHVLARAGATVTIAGRHAERGAFVPAAEHRTGLLEPNSRAGRGEYDLAIEATGDASVLPRLVPHVRPRGTIVLKSTTEKSTTIDVAPIVVDEITLIGSRCGRFAPALEELARGELDLHGWVDGHYSLEQGPKAVARAGSRGVLKVLIDPRT
ncbi:MAG: alcohol dehydrogenase catalytic domain-containing protein [Planctomycetes bacterium]|nr:alcohol dehydrogenase catalytic domain-containing protein [Planctomycetota bacterium]